MTADREWVRRRFWSHGESWHLRTRLPRSRRAQSTDAVCGDWFWSSEALAVWDGEGGPPRGDCCGVCARASSLREARRPADPPSGFRLDGERIVRTSSHPRSSDASGI